MDFKTYVKGDRVIRTTETAFHVLYEAQGFSLLVESEAEADGPAGGSDSNHRKSAAPRKRKAAQE